MNGLAQSRKKVKCVNDKILEITWKSLIKMTIKATRYNGGEMKGERGKERAKSVINRQRNGKLERIFAG